MCEDGLLPPFTMTSHEAELAKAGRTQSRAFALSGELFYKSDVQNNKSNKAIKKKITKGLQHKYVQNFWLASIWGNVGKNRP